MIVLPSAEEELSSRNASIARVDHEAKDVPMSLRCSAYL